MWTNEQMYWAWRETAEQEKKRIAAKGTVPPPPTKKVLDYVKIGTFGLCIGVWDDDKYTPLHRDELEFHLRPLKTK